MTGIAKALAQLWGGFIHDGQKIPAYLSGHVPKDATFPYFTFETAEGGFLGGNVLTAFVWLKSENGQGINAQRAKILDAVRQAIPVAGRVLRFSGGCCAIYPNADNFLSFYDDPEDKTVYGGRISYEIRFYTP